VEGHLYTEQHAAQWRRRMPNPARRKSGYELVWTVCRIGRRQTPTSLDVTDDEETGLTEYDYSLSCPEFGSIEARQIAHGDSEGASHTHQYRWNEGIP